MSNATNNPDNVFIATVGSIRRLAWARDITYEEALELVNAVAEALISSAHDDGKRDTQHVGKAVGD